MNPGPARDRTGPPGVRRAVRRDVVLAHRVIRRLELTITRRVDGLLHGQHRGVVAGSGLEPGDSRRYVPGDEVRFIDWAATARTGEPQVRIPVAEHDHDSWVAVDVSPSMQFGTSRHTKRELALAATAVVGFLNLRDGNRLGAVLGGGAAPAEVLRPRRGRPHVHAVLDAVATRPLAPGPTRLAGLLSTTARFARRRSLVVIISDLLAGDPWEAALRNLARRHPVLVVEIVDPRELTLPSVGVVTLVDVETGRLLDVPTQVPSVRKAFANAAAERRARHAAVLRAAGVDHLVLRTDQPWLPAVVAFLQRHRRRQRMVRAAPVRSPGR